MFETGTAVLEPPNSMDVSWDIGGDRWDDDDDDPRELVWVLCKGERHEALELPETLAVLRAAHESNPHDEYAGFTTGQARDQLARLLSSRHQAADEMAVLRKAEDLVNDLIEAGTAVAWVPASSAYLAEEGGMS